MGSLLPSLSHLLSAGWSRLAPPIVTSSLKFARPFVSCTPKYTRFATQGNLRVYRIFSWNVGVFCAVRVGYSGSMGDLAFSFPRQKLFGSCRLRGLKSCWLNRLFSEALSLDLIWLGSSYGLLIAQIWNFWSINFSVDWFGVHIFEWPYRNFWYNHFYYSIYYIIIFYLKY